jgi:hypothetical protein
MMERTTIAAPWTEMSLRRVGDVGLVMRRKSGSRRDGGFLPRRKKGRR